MQALQATYSGINMAHYAFLDDNNVVLEVLVGIDETNTDELPEGFDSWEAYYTNIKGKTCKRTSYNTYKNTHLLGGTAFRGTYAGIGYIYEADNDRFIPYKPYDSWTWNEDSYNWIAPVALPDTDNEYDWNESTQSWDLVE